MESEIKINKTTLSNLLQRKSLQWIMFGGKGGVGKTTISCSFAIELSKFRESVLIISTDPAHNLSDAFDQKITSEPTKINGFTNLYAMETNNSFELDEKDDLEKKLDNSQSNPTFNFFQNATKSFPGIDEMMNFFNFMKLVSDMEFSVVVFDTAPTGHTLKLLSLPEFLNKPFSKIFDLKSTALKLATKLMPDFLSESDEPEEEQMDILNKSLDQVTAQLRDSEKTTFINVCIAEFLSLYETERMVQELFKFGINTNNLVVNQLIIPEKSEKILEILKQDQQTQEEIANGIQTKLKINSQNDSENLRFLKNCPLCDSRSRLQKKYLDDIDILYEDFYVTKMPLFPFEIRGIERLKRFSQLLFDPY
ncbi:atpase asna1 [Anaeramoeba ignava]|uniref:Atpase asna1 n=1 Tax=Anaeramoeba ignava TaxID=1746090 RepID=A0A9Q0L6H5_ANAIG|nr:atpase asna1 [Anaeramoeba ignava]